VEEFGREPPQPSGRIRRFGTRSAPRSTLAHTKRSSCLRFRRGAVTFTTFTTFTMFPLIHRTSHISFCVGASAGVRCADFCHRRVLATRILCKRDTGGQHNRRGGIWLGVRPAEMGFRTQRGTRLAGPCTHTYVSKRSEVFGAEKAGVTKRAGTEGQSFNWEVASASVLLNDQLTSDMGDAGGYGKPRCELNANPVPRRRRMLLEFP
jgi:hypothetical protein